MTDITEGHKPRELYAVIDAIAAIIPELKEPLAHTRRRCIYAASEVMWMYWRDAQGILVREMNRLHAENVITDDQYRRVGAVWSGKAER